MKRTRTHSLAYIHLSHTHTRIHTYTYTPCNFRSSRSSSALKSAFIRNTINKRLRRNKAMTAGSTRRLEAVGGAREREREESERGGWRAREWIVVQITLYRRNKERVTVEMRSNPLSTLLLTARKDHAQGHSVSLLSLSLRPPNTFLPPKHATHSLVMRQENHKHNEIEREDENQVRQHTRHRGK